MKAESPISTQRRAVIDVGTNSVKLLIAEVEEERVRPLFEQSEQTRLGKGFYESHVLQSGPIAMTARSVARFAAMAKTAHPSAIRVIATSATRDAVNQTELLAAIEKASGLHVDVITGEVEAGWVFRGVMSDARLAGAPVMILDIGGGSTEFIVGQGRTPSFRSSFPMGTVRLTEQQPISDPPTPAELKRCRTTLAEFLRSKVRPSLDPALAVHPHGQVRLASTGGTSTIIARIERQIESYDREIIESKPVTLAAVSRIRDDLWSKTLAVRKEILGLPAERADVIPGGAAILAAVMEEFGFEDVLVSTRGLRFGALLDWPAE